MDADRQKQGRLDSRFTIHGIDPYLSAFFRG